MAPSVSLPGADGIFYGNGGNMKRILDRIFRKAFQIDGNEPATQVQARVMLALIVLQLSQIGFFIYMIVRNHK